MSKKDYKLIAAEIEVSVRMEDLPTTKLALARLVRRLCEAFGEENPRFDPARFRAACGISS